MFEITYYNLLNNFIKIKTSKIKELSEQEKIYYNKLIALCGVIIDELDNKGKE